MKQMFETKKDFITCSNLMINELGRCPTRTENIYFANDEQASIAVFTAVFCFTHAKRNLIKLKLYNKWSVQAVNSISECVIQTTNAEVSTCDKNSKDMYNSFYESMKFIGFWCRDKKKTEDSENAFVKALAKNFLLTSKWCSWLTFYQIDFMKRYWYVTLLCYITKSR